MNSDQLLQTLQLSDSFFPVGAFAYSDGIETAATIGTVHDGASLLEWMNAFIDRVFVPCDGLALFQCMRAIERQDTETVFRLDRELTAIKPAASVRASSTGIGRRLLTAYAGISGRTFDLPEGNAAIAYGVVFADRGIDPREALLAFGYGRLAGSVSAALRLISIGHQQAQGVLTQAIARLPGAADRIAEMQSEPLRTFHPILDIQQMNHRFVYSRLFRS